MPRINQLTTRTPAGADLLPFDKDIGGGSFLSGKATFREVMEGTRGLDTFATRAAFVTANAATPGLGLSDGQVVVAGGYEYRRLGASSDIPDLLGWVANGQVTVQHYGAIGDGVTDDTNAIKSAFTYSTRLHFPRGEYLVTGKNIVPPVGATERHISGEGMGVSVIKWTGDDGVGTVGTTNLFNFLDVITPLDHVSFRDITFHGTHNTNRSQATAYPLYIRSTKRVEFSRVEVGYSRIMGIVCRGVDFVSATSCYVHHCARDGINFANCNRTIISDNRCEYLDDDAIAVHNQVYRDCRGHTITGNNIFMAQGIVALGIQAGTITGNTLQYFFGRGINVQTYAAPGISNEEGANAATGVVISSNVLMDPIDRAGLDARSSTVPCIQVSGTSATAGTGSVVPGDFGTSPYGFYQNASGVTPAGSIGLPIPASGEISVTGNVVKRTMPLTGNFSTLGYGLFWLRDGEYDYNMATSATTGSILFLAINEGQIDGLLVANNVVSGINLGIQVNATGKLRNCLISDNQFSDMAFRGFQIVPSGVGKVFGVTFDGNTFDGDPYHRNANRTALGRWAADTNLTCILAQGGNGLVFKNNTFKNWSRLTDFDIAASLSAGLTVWEGNDIWGDPVALGFSTSNAGVGNFPSGLPDVGFVHVECDPAASNFGDVYRLSRLSRTVTTAIPSSPTRKYVAGEVVRVTSLTVLGTAPNRYMLRGWLRLTTGTTQVVGTDWVELRAPIE